MTNKAQKVDAFEGELIEKLLEHIMIIISFNTKQKIQAIFILKNKSCINYQKKI